MKIIGYTRVSTTEQASSGLGLEIQAAAIRAWCKANDHELVGPLFTDAAVSGATDLQRREGLASALLMIRKRKARGIVVARLDRLARDLMLQESILADVWKVNGQVFSCEPSEQQVLYGDDPNEPTRKFIRQVLGAVGELERALIRRRMQAGRDRARAEGRFAGHGSPPFGMRSVAGELVPDPAEQAALERLRELAAAGMSCRKIADALNEQGVPARRARAWYPQTVSRALKRSLA